jgi:4-alpha-glucanotransferase
MQGCHGDDIMKTRGSGILLHITSLPSRFGIGDLGPEAYRFADFLARTRQKYWQILPLNPTDPAYDNNPYHSTSAFAQNPLLISPEIMADDGLVDAMDIGEPGSYPEEYVDFARAIFFREELFSNAYDRFIRKDDRREYWTFLQDQAWWLDDYALFAAIRQDRNGEPWSRWPDDLKRRNPEALKNERERLHDQVGRVQFLQFVVTQQWRKLRSYCHERSIRIIGDIPIYVDYDSADVWCHPENFKLDGDLRPTVVAGVPPDYFSATGQLWHNPVYQWETLQGSGFEWWMQRMKRNLSLVDYVRIDHFRGLVACWEVPAGSDTAMDGRWVEAPADRLLSAFARMFPCLPVIAEDLGVITPDVREIIRKFGLPGMKVLLFAFEDDFPKSPYLPHSIVPDCIMYTGTHDNNPVLGWAKEEALGARRFRLTQYLGRDIPDEELNWEFIRMAMATVANTTIIPLQDVIGLGSGSRMNRPGTDRENWKWRYPERMLTSEIQEKLRIMTAVYARD